MKKILLIALTCALLISAASCGSDKSDKKKSSAKDTTEKVEVVTDDEDTPVTDANGETVVKEPEAEDSSNDTSETQPNGTVIEPNPDPSVNDSEEEGADGYITYEDEEGNTIVEVHTEPEKQNIEANNKWPSEVPSEVPAFTAFTEMDPPYYQDYGEYGLWTMGFFTTEADFDAYTEQLAAAGFVKSEYIYGIWGKGSITIDTWAEELDGKYWISLDVYKYNDPEVPDAFYAFETSYAIYFVEKRDGQIEIGYECGTDFEGEAKTYLETLEANGFTVTDSSAVKTVNGTEYTCTIDTENQKIIYTF